MQELGVGKEAEKVVWSLLNSSEHKVARICTLTCKEQRDLRLR